MSKHEDDQKNNLVQPPNWALKFLRWFCREDLIQGVEGDLVAIFNRRIEEMSPCKAKLFFVLNVLMFFKPFAIKPLKRNRNMNPLTTFKLNLKFATRNLLKTRVNSSLNIFSLSIGLMAVILLATYISHELSFDKFHSLGDRTFRFGYQIESDNQPTRQLAWVSALVAPEVQESYPEIEQVVRVRNCGGTMTGPGNQAFLEENGFFTGDAFFEVFDFKLLNGTRSDVLDEPYKIVLTQNLAEKYFGNSDPIGQFLELRIRDTLQLEVSGVVENTPSNSHFQFDYLVSHKTRELIYPHIRGWFSLGTHTYFRLQEGVDKLAFDKKIENLVMDAYGEEALRMGFTIKLFTQPLWDIHLKSNLGNEISANGNITYIYIAGGISLAILIISIFNFVNLFIARSVKFTKQIGIKKVIGANQSQLIYQSLMETLVMLVIAFSIAILLAYIFLPYFEQLVSRELFIQWFGTLSISSLSLLLVIVGLLAGLYPAILSTTFRLSNRDTSVTSLKKQGGSLSQSFLIVQFGLATILICSVLVIRNQLNFMTGSSLGFNNEQVAVIELWNNRQARGNTAILKTKLLESPTISSITASNSIPGEFLLDRVGYPDGDDSKSQVMFSLLVQDDFLELYDLNLVAGRGFSSEISTDATEAFIVNETAVSEFGWVPDQAIGRDFQWGSRSGKIIGVIEDFHYYGLQEKIPPMMLLQTERGVGYMSIKIEGEILKTVEFIEASWNELYENQVFDLFFLDDRFNEQYLQEGRLNKIITLFTLIGIVIACGGLFGLTALNVEKRMKEIGIRKVVGATIPSILILIGKRFFRLILLSFLIAIPISYLLAKWWLNDFAFRIDLGFIVFLQAIFLSLMVAAITVIFQSYKAASLDPVKVIKYE